MAVRDSLGTLHRHTAGTDGARPKNGMHSCRKNGLLAPMGPADDPDATGNQVSRNGCKATRRTADQAWRETETEEMTRQRTLPACGMQGANDEEQRPPKRSRALNVCTHQWGEGGGKGGYSSAHAHYVRTGTGVGSPDTPAHSPSARPGAGGGGGTPHSAARPTRAQAGERGGHLVRPRANTVCSLRA